MAIRGVQTGGDGRNPVDILKQYQAILEQQRSESPVRSMTVAFAMEETHDRCWSWASAKRLKCQLARSLVRSRAWTILVSLAILGNIAFILFESDLLTRQCFAAYDVQDASCVPPAYLN